MWEARLSQCRQGRPRTGTSSRATWEADSTKPLPAGCVQYPQRSVKVPCALTCGPLPCGLSGLLTPLGQMPLVQASLLFQAAASALFLLPLAEPSGPSSDVISFVELSLASSLQADWQNEMPPLWARSHNTCSYLTVV